MASSGAAASSSRFKAAIADLVSSPLLSRLKESWAMSSRAFRSSFLERAVKRSEADFSRASGKDSLVNVEIYSFVLLLF